MHRFALSVALIATLPCFASCGDDSGGTDTGAGTTSGGTTAGETGADTEVAESSGGSGETDAADTTAGEDESTGGTGPGVECELSDGENLIEVNGQMRTVFLDLPSGVEDGGPWPVVFNWHGLGDSAGNFRQLVAPYVDDPDFPFIGVTPEDTDFALMLPGIGTLPLDWEVFMVDEANAEIALFDATLACLDAQYGVDADRVHTMGFSLGSILSDLIGSMRGEVIASIATYSGGYWNNPNSDLGFVALAVSWPEHPHSTPYPQLFLHGGETDTFEVSIAALSFSDFANADAAWFVENGHPTFLCDHGGGHTAPPAAMGPEQLLQFFADHPRGVDSPYAGALPEAWPDYCQEVAE